MVLRVRRLVLIVLAAFLALPEPAVAGDLEVARRLCHESLALLHSESGMPALQVAVGMRGRIVYSDAFGWASLESRAPATTTTKFRIASVSKPITGTVAARLATQGRFDLDRSVCEYLPDYPEHAAAVTPRMLAAHLGGVRHYKRGEANALVRYPELAAALAIFSADPLAAAPGEKMIYSTYGFTLLGAAMEQATKQSFIPLVQAELLEPLGMSHTVGDRLGPVIADRAAPYQYERGEVVNAAPTDHGYKLPGGGFLSTAEDLVRFGLEVADPHHLDEATVALMTTPARTNGGRELSYGLGWSLFKSSDGRRLVGHSGGQPGSSAFLLVDPEADVAVVVLSNISGAPFGQTLAELIAERFRAASEWETAAPARSGRAGRYVFVQQEGDREAVLEILDTSAGVKGVASIGDERLLLTSAACFQDRLVAWGYDRGLVDVELRFEEASVTALITTSQGRQRFQGQRLETPREAPQESATGGSPAEPAVTP